MSDAVEASGLDFRYGERQALSQVGFRVAPGSVHGFLGPNGSGKSTLFKILATILPLQTGSVGVLGMDLRTQTASIRRVLGVVFQSPALDRKLSVRANLRYGGMLYGLSGAELDRRVDKMLEVGSLRDRARDRVGELSGGLRRRVELAKGLLHGPQLMLLDEPSTGLDPGARQDLWRFLRAREGVTILFTTHLMDEADEADGLTILNAGQIVAEGSPASLRQEVGGEVLELSCAEPAALARDIAAAFGVEPQVLDHSVRIQREQAHGLVADLMRTYGERIEKVVLSHPSLEDVFIARTGQRLREEG